MLCLDAIKIFLAQACDAPPDEWMSGMAGEKRSRINKFKNEKDRQLAVTAHRLLCYALHHLFGIVPYEEDFANGLHGKPYLKNAPHVHYNLSHAGSVVMCALHNAPVGVDIEVIGQADESVARRIMSREELAAFESASDKNGLFYKIWTLKEAYIKYSGRGLGSQLKRLTIYPDKDHIISSVSGCTLALIDAVPGYQAAVCAAKAGHSVEWVQQDKLAGF